MEFRYKAKKNLNDIVEGKIEADSVEQVIGKLERAGLIPVSIEGTKEGARLKEKKKVKLGRWSSSKRTLFTQKLYNLTKTHVELLSALRIIEEGSSDSVEKALLGIIIKDIKDGVSFSESLSKFPQYFSPLYVNIICTGEGSGQLKEALAQILRHLQRVEDLRSKVLQALAYPIFMIVVGIGTIFVMLTFILPRIASIFEDYEAILPLPTRILLNTSGYLQKYWYVVIILALLTFILQKKGNFFSRIKYRFPLIRRIILKQSIANFSRSSALLLKSGVTLLSTLGVVSPIIGDPVRIKQLEKVSRQIKEGNSFSRSLSQFNIFPEFFVQMIKVGEEGGRLDSVFEDIAEAYEEEIAADLKIISSLLEPAIILALGLIIGGMVMAILLPIFNINTLVGT